jgi:hypothetical protein
MIFQRLHLLAHGSSRYVQLFGGGAEALVPGNYFEGSQRIQRWQSSTHRVGLLVYGKNSLRLFFGHQLRCRRRLSIAWAWFLPAAPRGPHKSDRLLEYS